MFNWIGDIKKKYKENAEFYEKPLLFVNSNSVSLKNLLNGKGGHFIRVKNFEDINYGLEYFDFIEHGIFVRKLKHNPIRQGIAANQSHEEWSQIVDHSKGYGHWSVRYTEDDIFSLVFNERLKK